MSGTPPSRLDRASSRAAGGSSREPRAILTRRGLLGGAAALVLPSAAGCRCIGAPDPADPIGAGAAGSGGVTTLASPWQTLTFEPSAVYSEPGRALVLVPEGAASLPIVVALHGRGETRSLDIGARGFRDFYGLDRIDARLRAPPLTRDDLLGFTNDERLARLNASLAASPYGGVVLASPYAPDLADRSFEGAAPYGRFVTEVLLPRARELAARAASTGSSTATGMSPSAPGAAPAVGASSSAQSAAPASSEGAVSSTPSAMPAPSEGAAPSAPSAAPVRSPVPYTGIDGVSMGGRLALWIGLRFPEMFRAVGAMQPALRPAEAGLVARLAADARARNPALRIRLLSSEDDPFLAAVKATSEAMRALAVEHDLVVVPGPHNYEWNRGPGCTEMLLWQERALRGLASP